MAKATNAKNDWLWNLLPAGQRPGAPRRDGARRADRPAAEASRGHARHVYNDLVSVMKQAHAVRVRRWRGSNSGCAWEVTYADGHMVRLIEAPRPRGPVSAAVFLHEVGHHAIGFHRYKLRCFEEYMAWQWALDAMRANGIAVTAKVERRVEGSMRYAVAKAKRRGLKRLPVELVKYAR
jgi:hypothetical protein